MIKRLTIGIDIRDLKIARTGARTYLEELYNEFSKPDTEIKFYFFNSTIPVYTGRNKILKLIEHFRFLLWKQLILPVKSWVKGCDIIFCTDFFVPYINLGFKTIPVFHDAFFWEYPQHYNRYWLAIFKWIGVNAAKRSPFIVTPTNYTKHRLIHYMDIEPDRIVVIPEAPKTFGSDTATLPSNKHPSLKYILHAGTLEKRKNLRILIKAFSLLIKEGMEDYSLVLLGQASPKKDMDDSRDIKKAIEAYGLTDKVIMPGYVDDQTLAQFYRDACIYVFPSINEGFGLPVLEAFYYKIPVIIADNTCLPEVGGDAVLTFNPHDIYDLTEKMKLIINNRSLQESLIKKGEKRLEDFSWSKTALLLKDLFTEAAKGR